EPGIKWRSLQRLSGRESVTEVERVKAAGDSILIRSALDCEPPTTAPSQLTEPHRPMSFVGFVSLVDRKPGIRFIPRTAPPALNDTFPDLQCLGLELPFAGPASREVMQPAWHATWQCPRSGL